MLDLVISSEEDMVVDLRIGESDHAMTLHEREKNNTGLDYREAYYVSIVREMIGMRDFKRR